MSGLHTRFPRANLLPPMIQNSFLARFKDQQHKVAPHLLKGVRITRRIAAFDLYGFVLRDELGHSHYVYKQSVWKVVDADASIRRGTTRSEA